MERIRVEYFTVGENPSGNFPIKAILNEKLLILRKYVPIRSKPEWKLSHCNYSESNFHVLIEKQADSDGGKTDSECVEKAEKNFSDRREQVDSRVSIFEWSDSQFLNSDWGVKDDTECCSMKPIPSISPSTPPHSPHPPNTVLSHSPHYPAQHRLTAPLHRLPSSPHSAFLTAPQHRLTALSQHRPLSSLPTLSCSTPPQTFLTSSLLTPPSSQPLYTVPLSLASLRPPPLPFTTVSSLSTPHSPLSLSHFPLTPRSLFPSFSPSKPNHTHTSVLPLKHPSDLTNKLLQPSFSFAHHPAPFSPHRSHSHF
ncbi:hypothetical protein RJT34_13220 [Clitoria ternatea]|uniref:Uncharacterized protein n=1 Tax=Clitoria ternatea TaxID=43366 RepID=A0AAN9JNL7_CLITE